MSCDVIALTQPCVACAGIGEYVEPQPLGMDVIYTLVRCDLCHGTGNSIRPLVFEKSLRRKLKARVGQ